MYNSSVCISNTPNVYTDVNVNPPSYQPTQNTEPAASAFQSILEQSIGGTNSPSPTNSENPVSQPESPGYFYGNGYNPAANGTPPAANETQTTNNVTPPVTNGTPPPITNGTTPPTTTQPTPEAFSISRYYSIEEDDVIPKLRGLRQLINTTDLTGKSDVEKFDFIERQFIDAFGKDFMMARNVGLPSSMFYIIGIEFTDTLSRHIEDPANVNRERLFGDKSTEDIQNSIRERFPDVLTNRDLFLMVNEMRNAGVLDANSLRSIGTEGVNNVFDTLNLLRSYAKISTQNSNDDPDKLTLEERDRRWSSMLNMPISLNNLMRLYNAWSQDSRFSMGGDVASFIQNFLGGEKGENGLFIVKAEGDTLGANHNAAGPPVHINIIGGNNYGTIMSSGDDNSVTNINVSTGSPPATNTSNSSNSGAKQEEDWAKMLTMMLRGMDEYDDLVRSRMAMIDAEDNPGTGEYPGTGENPGIGENPEVGENTESGEYAGAEENPEVEEAPGAEENLDAEDAGEESGGEESSEGQENAA